MKRKDIKRQNLIQLLLSLVIIVLLNVVGSYVFTRLDLTSEKRYSLSPATKDMLSNMEDVAFVRVYLEGEFPAGFKNLRNATREMLDEFRVYAGDNVEYEFVDPFEGADDNQKKDIFKQLVSKGLKPTNYQEKLDAGESSKVIFPGAIISYRGRELPVQLLQNKIGVPPEVVLNNSVQTIEFELANAIHKLTQPKKPTVTFIEGHGELDKTDVQDITTWLSDAYTVNRVQMDGQLHSLDGTDVVIVAKPDSAFSEKDKYILDQFIMNGGKALFLLDAVYTSMDSLRTSNFAPGIAVDVNLADMLFKYGARINNNLVMDAQLAAQIPVVTGQMNGMPQQSLLPWPFFPVILPRSQHPIVKNLDGIKMEFANSVDTVGSPNIHKTILLSTSPYSRIMNAPARVSLQVLNDMDPALYNHGSIPVGVLLEGKFESVFKNRLPETLLHSQDIKFREEGEPTTIIVVGDGDVIRNDVKKSTGMIYPMDQDRYTRQPYGNRTFILNAVDYMVDKSGLFTVRSKELRLRLMDKKKLSEQVGTWQAFNMGAPVLLILIFAVIFGWMRRKKYGRSTSASSQKNPSTPEA